VNNEPLKKGFSAIAKARIWVAVINKIFSHNYYLLTTSGLQKTQGKPWAMLVLRVVLYNQDIDAG